MENKINIALENLKKAILSEMDEMSEKHKITFRKLSNLKSYNNKLNDEINGIINTLANMCFCKNKICNRCGFNEPLKTRCENENIRTEVFKKLDILKLNICGQKIDWKKARENKNYQEEYPLNWRVTSI